MQGNESLLTNAWSPIRERHGVGLTGSRKAYNEDSVRFKVVAAGRRSTKTLIAKRRVVRALIEHLLIPREERPVWWNETWKYFYGAPTQDQANDIALNDCTRLIPPDWIKRTYKGSKPVIKTVWNSELHIVGMDEARRIEGQPWNGGVLDEFPDMKPDIWEANIVPILTDRKAWLIILGVPDYDKPNNRTFRRLFEKGMTGLDPEWKSYTWFSDEVLDEAAIEMMRATMSPPIFRQETQASWESAPGRAYPDFNFARNVKRCDFGKTLMVGCDFNRKHHTWGLYAYHDGAYYIIEDLYGQNATVETMCRMLHSRIAEQSFERVEFYGDYSGNQKKAESTDSAWQQIYAFFPDAFYGVKPQPPVSDRIEKVNAFVLNADNEVRLFCHPQAQIHQRDFEEVSRVMAFAGDGGNDGELTHASSALGYTIWQHQLLLKAPEVLNEPILFFG